MSLKFKTNTVSIAIVSLIVFTLLMINPGCEKHNIKWNLDRINPIDSANSTINPSGSPTVNTTSISSITQNSAIVSGEIISLGNSTISQHGHCWSTSTYPTISDSKTTFGSMSNLGTYSSSLNGLNNNSTYFVRSYATNSSGTAYGNQISFTAGQNTYAPIITTGSVSNVTTNSASVTGIISDLGGSPITQHGHCWSTSSNPTISNSKTTLGSTSTIGSFNSNISNLNPITTYYIRTYATNNTGTAYGNQVNFTTNFQNVTCNITSSTTGTDYTVISPTQSVFNSGDSYTITLYSPTYAFNQASSVELYLDENQVYSFGTWLVFSNNTRAFNLPTVATASNCYTLRVFYFSDIYISTPFTIY